MVPKHQKDGMAKASTADSRSTSKLGKGSVHSPTKRKRSRKHSKQTKATGEKKHK